MRWAAVLTIAVLLAGVPCLPACALAAWTQQTPPCHQHNKAPAPAGDFCDHQNAVKDASPGQLLVPPVLAIFDTVTPHEMAVAVWAAAGKPGIEIPPPLGRLSVLRI